MHSRAEQKRSKEGTPLSYSIWSFSQLDEAKRGGTAPGPSEKNFSYPKKLPASSHKFTVNSINSPILPQSSKFSMRGSGWNSSDIRAPVKLLTIRRENPKLSTLKPPEDLKRPLTISYQVPEITKLNENKKHRPPPKHKTPPKALNLYLPAGSCTPPEEIATKDMFEKTWSICPKEPEHNEPQYSDRKTTESPTFKHAWDEGVTRPKTQNEKTRRMRLLAAQEKVQPLFGNDIIKNPDKLYEVPIILNRDEKYTRRIFSAHIIETNSPKSKPASYKTVKAAFQSSLDGDFLNLFESTS
ncbi:unnamed protein product [Blepharisma stoltei]|uniref:Uncharacterized protein n=1 Tax=Blepharisma stoltei TaxID=1481888 RepID=A0AAU9J5U8_9CILI|nr:unnamed protein product [Blepharisma stoltei]